MQKSLIINSVDQSGNARAKSITNINPEASNEQLQEFAQRLTALSTNTYSGASVVTKSDVTEAVGGGVASGKQKPTITWGTIPSDGPRKYEGNIEYTLNSDTPTVLAGYYITDEENDSLQDERFNEFADTRVLYLTTKNAAIPVSVNAGAGSYWCHLFVAAEETDNYEAAVFRNGFWYAE